MGIPRLASVSERLGHLALWAGLYVAGALVALALLTETASFLSQPADWSALAIAFFAGVGVYLLDRVKFADRLLDPADACAHPRRYAFVTRRRTILRTLGGAMGLLAAAVALTLHPALPLVVAGAFAGGFLYAGLPARPHPRRARRIKDILILKNAGVACSIVIFAAVLLLAARGTGGPWIAILVPAIVLAAIVFGDAVLCDIDDARADRRFGTRTIPGTFSARTAWGTGLGSHVIAGIGACVRAPSAPVLVMAIGLPATTAILIAWRPRRVRDLVDMRLPAIASLALLAAYAL